MRSLNSQPTVISKDPMAPLNGARVDGAQLNLFTSYAITEDFGEYMMPESQTTMRDLPASGLSEAPARDERVARVVPREGDHSPPCQDRGADTRSSSIPSDPARDLNESRRTQLGILQQRIILHGSRMWQLPLTYLAAIGGSISLISPDRAVSSRLMSFGLLCFGVVLCFCMHGANEGYRRSINDMNKVERLLGIDEFAKNRRFHTLPLLGPSGRRYGGVRAPVLRQRLKGATI